MKISRILSVFLAAALVTGTVAPGTFAPAVYAEETTSYNLRDGHDFLQWDEVSGASSYTLNVTVDGGTPYTRTSIINSDNQFFKNSDGKVQAGKHTVQVEAVLNDGSTVDIGTIEITVDTYSDGTTTFWYKQNSDDSGCTLLSSDFAGGELTLPVSINGVTVCDVGCGCFDGAGVTGELVIPEGYDRIGVNAFAHNAITSISFPDSMQSLNSLSFGYCDKLTSVELPKNLSGIYGNPFGVTYSLENIGCSAENKWFKSVDGVIYSADGASLVCASSARSDESFTVADGTREILWQAVYGAKGITNVELNDGLENIYGEAFMGCTLYSVRVPYSVQFIGAGAFGWDIGWKWNSAFGVYGGAVAEAYAKQYGFAYNSMGDSSDDSSYDFGFKSNDTLTWNSVAGATQYNLNVTVEGGTSYVKVEQNAQADQYYRNNDGVIQTGKHTILVQAVLSDGTTKDIGTVVLTIGSYSDGATTFYYKTNADGTYTLISSDFSGGELTLPGSINGVTVTGIGHGCFTNTGITGNLVIPEGVKRIYGEAFSSLNITGLTLPDTLEYLDGNSFSNCRALKTVELPRNLTETVWNPFASSESLESIGCSDENTSFTSVDGVIYTRNRETLCFGGSGKSGTLLVPETTRYIGPFAFIYASNLTELELCDGLENIGFGAFIGCGFTSVKIPETVTNIDSNAFGYDSSWSKIDGFTIIGVKGSAAEKYATDNGFEFTEYTPGTEYEDVAITEENFPDAVFRDYITYYYDTNPCDGVLSGSELLKIKYLNIDNRGISSLKGVELLPEVLSINCSNNPITSIDISGNKKLQQFDASNCSLAALDLSANTSLVNANISGNVFDYKITDGMVPVEELPADFDLSRAFFDSPAYYDSDKNAICTTLDYITYSYNCGAERWSTFCITDKSVTVKLEKDDKVCLSMPDDAPMYKGQAVYVSVMMNDFIGRRLLINGEEKQLTLNGDGIRWGVPVTVDSDTLKITLEECDWTDEQMSSLVRLNHTDDLVVFSYNSYYDSIVYNYRWPSGGYFGRNYKLVMMTEVVSGVEKKFVVNGQTITPEVSGGNYVAYYTIPDDVSELNISVTSDQSPYYIYFGSNDCLYWSEVEGAQSYDLRVSVDGKYAYTINWGSNMSDYFVEQNAPIRTGMYRIDAYALMPDGSEVFISNISVEVRSAEYDGSKYFYKQNSEGYLTIIGAEYGKKDIVIPAELDGVRVTEIGQASLWNHDEIESLVISEGIKKVQGKSISGCVNLKTISLPDSLELVDGYAFEGCTSVTSMTVPKNVSHIVWSPFNRMTSLTEINCDPENQYYTSVDGVLFKKDMTSIVAYPVGRKGAYTVPETVKYIEPYVFNGAEYLTDITILGDIGGINNGAFEDCKNLRSVTITDGVEYVGSYAFKGCVNIKHFYVPESVTNIGDRAFGFQDFDSIDPEFYLSGKEGSMIEVYAFRYGIPFNPDGKSEKDPFDGDKSQTGSVDEIDGDISVTPPTNIQDKNNKSFDFSDYFFSVSKVKDLQKEENYKNLLEGKNSDKVHFLDLDLTDEEGKSYGEAFSGLVQVDIPYPLEYLGNGYGRYHLYRMTEKGIEEIPGKHVSLSGKHFYRVYLEHFSDYALVENDESESSAECVGHSILLDNGIGVKFYMDLSGAFASEQSEMVFSVAGRRYIFAVSEAETTEISGRKVYVFTCPVAASEMTDVISAQIVSGDASSSAFSYSVQKYADYILENAASDPSLARAVPVVKAMLNYGARSQDYFGHNTDLPANAALSESDKVLTDKSAIDLSAYGFTVSDNDAAIDFLGHTLSLKGKTWAKLYFGCTSGSTFDIRNATVTSDGKLLDDIPVAVGSDEYGQYVIIEGIGAADYGRRFDISLGGVTVSGYSVFGYLRESLGSDDSRLVDVSRALYDYYRAVSDYVS